MCLFLKHARRSRVSHNQRRTKLGNSKCHNTELANIKFKSYNECGIVATKSANRTRQILWQKDTVSTLEQSLLFHFNAYGR